MRDKNSCSAFGRAVLSRLEELDMSLSDLSRASGVRLSSISEYIKGLYKPKAKKVLALARALKVDPAVLDPDSFTPTVFGPLAAEIKKLDSAWVSYKDAEERLSKQQKEEFQRMCSRALDYISLAVYQKEDAKLRESAIIRRALLSEYLNKIGKE